LTDVQWGATKHRTGRKLPHPNPSAAAAMLEVVVLGTGAVIFCRCSRWDWCSVSSHCVQCIIDVAWI